MSHDCESLAQAFPKEQARLRDLRDAYISIGPVGAFGLTVINAIRRMDEAAMSGDVVVMVRAYELARTCK